jgi:hypothetical protein
MFRTGGCCGRFPMMPEWLAVLFAVLLVFVFGWFVYLIAITVF